MRKSSKDMLKRLILVVSIISITLLPFLVNKNDVQAAAFTSVSDTMTRQKASTAANHTIAFTQNGSTQFVAGETITIDFEDTFDTSSLANTDPLDYDIVIGATEETIVAAGCGATDEIETTSISGTDVITFTACASYTAEAAGSTITIEIGTNATAGGAGDTQITNATSAGSKIISLGGTIGDTGQLAVPILAEDQVTVSATVDASITSTLSSTTCALGTLVTSAINTCSYTNTVITNATSGYSSTIIEDGELRDGANDINQETGDSDVDQGTEEYGVSSNDATGAQAIIDTDGTGCDGTNPEAASAITGTAQEYADNTGPVLSEVTTLCHAASIIGTTPAGSYSHLVTHITTGTF